MAGVVVLGLCAAWPLISAAGREARPEGALLAVFAVVAGYACGRISGTLLPVTAATALSLAALGLALASPDGVPGANTGAPAQPGHTGAGAALLVLSAGAACCAAAAARPPALRLALRLLALASVAAGLAVGSTAGFAACAGVLLCSVAAARMPWRRVALAGLALVTGVAAAVSWGVAEDALPDGLTVSLEGQLTPHRVALWQDAVALAKEDPVRGAGPGLFGRLSTTALQSAGSDGKPHSALFQQAADQGLVGVVLLATAFGWLLLALARSPRSTAVVLSAGAALTALAVLANLGNALSFTPVTTGAGLLAGLATARGAGETVRETGRRTATATATATVEAPSR